MASKIPFDSFRHQNNYKKLFLYESKTFEAMKKQIQSIESEGTFNDAKALRGRVALSLTSASPYHEIVEDIESLRESFFGEGNLSEEEFAKKHAEEINFSLQQANIKGTTLQFQPEEGLYIVEAHQRSEKRDSPIKIDIKLAGKSRMETLANVRSILREQGKGFHHFHQLVEQTTYLAQATADAEREKVLNFVALNIAFSPILSQEEKASLLQKFFQGNLETLKQRIQGIFPSNEVFIRKTTFSDQKPEVREFEKYEVIEEAAETPKDKPTFSILSSIFFVLNLLGVLNVLQRLLNAKLPPQKPQA